MAVAEPADLATLLGATWTPGQEERAADLLDLAEAAIAAEVPGIAFTETTDAAVDLPGTLDDTLYLPATPITAVASVTIDGSNVDPSTYRWRRTGEITRQVPYHAPWVGNGSDLCRGWGWPGATVHIEYTAGPTGGDIKLIELELVHALWTNPTGMTSETVGQYAATWATPGGPLVLSDLHRSVLRRYRPTLTSQPLRVDR
jgi:hypothetical protein